MNYSPNIAIVFAVTVVVLVLHLMLLWLYTGVARGRSGQVVNPEDAARWNKPLHEQDPPGAARALRVHANSQAMALPFLFLGLAYVLLNGNPLYAQIVFAAFCVLRIVYSIAYIASWQPARSILYGLSFLVLLVLAGLVVLRALQVAAVT